MGNWKYFTLEEMCASCTARSMQISNQPSQGCINNLARLVEGTLDPLRELWGAPLIVASGFRCPELNKAVGGVRNSYHKLGLAADIVTKGNDNENNFQLFELIKENLEALNIDLVIAENMTGKGRCGWVHIQTNKSGTRPRHLVIP